MLCILDLFNYVGYALCKDASIIWTLCSSLVFLQLYKLCFVYVQVYEFVFMKNASFIKE